MDMSLVASALAMQSANLQTNIVMQLMRSNAKAGAQTVQILLGTASGSASQANLPAGVGGRIDIAA
jgi:hypothetical protein